MDNKITLKEVAKIAQTSIRTVSRVINNSDAVNKKTRKRVKEVIKELDYKPNIIARSLASKLSRSIGVITMDINNPIFPPILRGIESFATKKNYSVIICDSQYNFKTELEHLDNLTKRMVDGIIILPTARRTFKKLREMSEQDVNIIVSGESIISNSEISSISINEKEAISNAMQYLIDKGHRRIVYIYGAINTLAVKKRLEGYRNVLKKNNISFDEKLVFKAQVDINGGYEIIKTIFNINIKFTAIMCFNDLIAMGIYKYCGEKKIIIPDQYSIIGFDDIFCSQFLNPPLTTIHQHKRIMGERLAEQLLKEINNKKLAHTNLVLPAELVIRKSVKKI